MNKTELIEYIQSNTGLSTAGSERALHITLLAISRTLSHGESVQLVGFGSFNIIKRPKRVGRHPKTGEVIKIKAKKVVKFLPSKALRDSVE